MVSTFVGYFIGSPGMNFMPAEIEGMRARLGGLEFELGDAYLDLPKGKSIQVGVRPEFVSLTPGPGLPVSVRRVADLGRKRLAYVNLGEYPIVASIPREMESVGDTANITIDPGNTHVYVDDIRKQGAAA